MKDVIVIGVDHGYAAMKAVHFSFPTGLVEYEHEPYTQKDVLEYNGRYYVVGSGRQPLQRDKTQTEDYYLLTLAAIAKELEHRGAEHTASVHLAAGLPLTSFGRDKKSFRSYLYRDGSAIPFRYEGQDYTVTIQEVSLFPQGYAAVLGALRGDSGPLRDLPSMRAYCEARPQALMRGRQAFYAFRIDTGKYRYYLRFFPQRELHKFFIFCYQTDRLREDLPKPDFHYLNRRRKHQKREERS